MYQMNEIILKPILSEKASGLMEKNEYVFGVKVDANKHQIKKALKELFDVDVVSVNTTTQRGKLKRFGRFMTQRPNFKKAYVKIKADQKIKIFQGA